jgi:DNA-binding NtrC family response regulator
MELLKDGVSSYTPKAIDTDELKTMVADGHGAALTEAPAAANGASNPLFADSPSLEEVKRRYIRHVIVSTNGNLSRAAAILDVDRRSLYRMIARLEIQVPGRD